MAVNALTYIKNVGKSVGYVSFKVVKEMNPVISEFTDTNAEITTTLYRTARDLKKNIKRMPEIIAESEYGKFGKSYLNNLMDDLKTGKFYNKEREEEFEMNAANTFAGLDGDDSDTFGDLDSLDFGDSDEEISSNEMMDIVGEKASTAVSTAMARSSEYIVESNIQIARANSKQMNAIYGGLHMGMNTINQNIAKVIEFSNEQTITHYENSRTFYETTTALNQERNQLLKSISESLTKLTEPPKEQEIRKGRYGKAVDYDGVLDIGNYFKIVKDNIQAKSGGLFDMFKMMTETTGLQNLVASPLEFLVEGMVKSVIPDMLKKTMDRFNQSLSGIFGNAMMFLQNKADNDDGGGFWRGLADIFGIETGLHTTLDTRQYEKGKVPFDGITRKTIVEVIPTYLSKILAAITGGKETRYNYEDGRFNTVEELRKKYNSRTDDHASSAASELSRVVREYKNRLDLNEAEQKRLEETWKQVSQFMYKNGTNFNTANKKLSGSDFGLYGDGVDLDIKLLQHLIGTYGRSENMKYAHRMYREREDQNEETQRYQQSTTYNSLFNRSSEEGENAYVGIKSLIDGANNAVVAELVNIKNNVVRIVDMMSQYGPGFRRSKKKKQKGSKVTTQTVTTTAAASESSSEDSESSEDGEGDPEPESIVDLATLKITEGAKKYNAAEELRKQKELEELEKASTQYDENGNPIKKKKKRKTLWDRFRSFRKGSKELIGVPLNFVGAVIEKADQRLYDMVFGYKDDAEDDEENSFMGKMLARLEDIFDNFSDYLHEKILDPLSEKLSKDNLMDGLRKVFKMFDADLDETIESVKNFFFDPKGSIGSFFEEYKQNMKDIFGWGKNAVKDTAEWAGASFNPELTDIGKAAKAKADKAKNDVKDIFGVSFGKTEEEIEKEKKEKAEQQRKKDEDEREAKTSVFNPTQAATGIKRVNKTGLAIISEGEMVIPPDMNPFNIAKRKRNEKKVKDNIKKSIDNAHEYAEGTFDALSEDEVNELSKVFNTRNPQKIIPILSKYIAGYDDMTASDKLSALDKSRLEFAEFKKRKSKSAEEEFDKLSDAEKFKNGTASIGTRMGREMANASTAIYQRVTQEFIGDEKEIEKFKNDSMDFIKDIKQYGPTMAAGATVGAGVSILTGLIGGPLVGAAVGAGAGLLAKSETFQEMLFGKFENGERQGGILSKDLSNNIRKYLPDVLKGGTVGSILAALPLVPGSPLMGMMLGSAVGFAKNNESVQEFLFGEDALLGDKKQFQEKVRRVLPKMGVGAVAGLLAGPFTTPVNLILGSALGFASDSKLFRDIVLGEEGEDGKRSGGFVGQIKDFLEKDIFDPVKRAKDPIMEQFRIIGESVKDSLFNVFKGLGDHVKSMLDDIIADPLKKAMNTVFKWITWLPKKLISLPFQAIGGIGDKLRTRQIKRGQASRYMQSAEDRNLYRQSKAKNFMFGDKYGDLDASLAGITDVETLDQLVDAAAVIKDKDKNIDTIKETSAKTISTELKKSNADHTIRKRVMTYINNGRYDKAVETLKNAKFDDPAVKENLIKTVSHEMSQMKQTQNMRDRSEETTKELLSNMEKLGLKVSPDMIKKLSIKDSKEAKNFYNILKNQRDYAFKYVDQTQFSKSSDDSNVDSGVGKNTTESVNKLHQTTRDKFDELIQQTKDSTSIESTHYKQTLEIQEKIYNAIGGLSRNTEEDLKLRGYKDIRGEGIGNDIRNKGKDYYNNIIRKGIIGGTIDNTVDTAKNLIGTGFKLLAKVTGAVAGTAANVVGGTVGAVGSIGSDIVQMGSDIRHSDPMESFLGDENTEWMNKHQKVNNSEWMKQYKARQVERAAKMGTPTTVSEDEVVIEQAAEGKVPGQKDAHSLFGLWEDISKSTKRMAATVIAQAHLDGLDTSKISDKGTAESYLTKITNKFKRNSTVTQFVDGLPIKMIRDNNGDLIPDPSDSDNDNNFKIINSERETQKGILASLQTMPSALGGFFKDIFADDEEEEESWFDKIFDFFTGAKDKVINLKNILLGAVKAAIPLGLVAFGLSGKLDNLVSALTGGAYGKNGANDKLYVTDENGNSHLVKTDENGNPVTDENGNYVTTDGTAVDGSLESHSSQMNMSLSDRLKYNTIRGTATGTSSIIGNVLKKNKVTKAIGKAVGNIKISNIGVDSAKLNAIHDLVNESITKWKGAIKGAPLISKYADKIDDLGKALIGKIDDVLAKSTEKTLGSATKSFAKLVAWPLLIAGAVVDFTTGWQDASNILKINPDYVTTPQKIICGLVRTIKNFIPIIGTFIPESIITDLFIDYVSSWVGIDTSEIKKQRSEAQEELDAYNLANPENQLTWAEYSKQKYDTYTWTERIGNTVKSGWENVKQFGKKITGNADKVSTTVASTPMVGSGSGLRLFTGRGTDETFVSQVDPRYKDKKFNIPGDTKVQTLGNTGCAPAAAAMAINATMGSNVESMESAAKNALNYKVNDDGVSADYFSDQFARHGIDAKYIESNGSSTSIMKELMQQHKVVLMGEDKNNTSKKNSPFGANPHYVVATGLSKDGKYIYINDPESNTPNIKYSTDKILRSSSLGISAKVANGTKKIVSKLRSFVGRGSYGSDTNQYKVWNALRKAGYNEIATAAAMGNIEAESGFEPNKVEAGSGAGYGLIQWTGPRRTALEQEAARRGTNVGSLAFQIDYLLKDLNNDFGSWTGSNSRYGLGSFSRNDWAKATNIDDATKAFMCCFERPDYDPNVNHIERRLQYARQYYQDFTGTAIDTNISLDFDESMDTVAHNNTFDQSTEQQKPKGFLGELFSALGGLASAFGLNTSSQSNFGLYGDSSSQSTGLGIKGRPTDTVMSADGNVSSNPQFADLQRKLVQKMYSIQGQLKYAQDNAKYPGSRNPEDGSGDCSSTVQWAYKNILGVDPGSWTGAQRDDSNTFTVATNTRDESKLQLGDLLLKDGHVEMYAGNGKMIGHGSDWGPKVKELDKSGKYDLVRRWVGFQDNSTKYGGYETMTATGSGLKPAYSTALRHIKPEKIESPLSINLEKEKKDTLEFNKIKVASGSTRRYIGRGIDESTQTDTKSTPDTTVQLVNLVKDIASILMQVVTNTDQLNEIVRLLNIIISGEESTTQKVSSSKTKDSDKKNTAILAKQNLINTMQSAGAGSDINSKLMRLIQETERIARA